MILTNTLVTCVSERRHACGESKEKKYELSVVLVDCTEAENRRFLEKGPDGLWYKVLGNGKRIKASQALRDVQTREG